MGNARHQNYPEDTTFLPTTVILREGERRGERKEI
jgi:hypothetical protein